MHALLIDPANKAVTVVNLPDAGDNLPTIYKHLQCERFDAVALSNGDTIYVDDEGLLKAPLHFFAVRGAPQPYAGRGLVVGVDERGRSVAPATSLQHLTDNVKFIELITRHVAIVRDAANPVLTERILPIKRILAALAAEADDC